MSRNLLLSLLTLGFLATGLYLGLSRNSLDEEKSRSAASWVRSQSVKPEASKSHTALPQGAFERRSERANLNPSVLGNSEVQKRDGPVPEEDDVYQLIEEALQSSQAEDRAFALSELGLLDPTPEILLACFEALSDPEEELPEDVPEDLVQAILAAKRQKE